MNTSTHTGSAGFTLVETLVAISILTIAIVGPYQLAQGVLQKSYIARDELIASSLAQEGIEYVREIRDSNFIYGNHHASVQPWLSGLDTSPNCYTSASVACWVDPAGATPVGTCTLSGCSDRPLYLSAGNLYNESNSGTVTKFSRSVQLTSVNANETKVTVTVSWNNHGIHTVVLTEDLQDWL